MSVTTTEPRQMPAVDPSLQPVPRRGVTRWLATGGMALITLAAGSVVNASPASAACERDLAPACCNLASCTQCSYPASGRCHYTCPGGYHQKWWFCISGTRAIGCGECVPLSSATCESGPFPCSIWWFDSSC